MVPVLVVQLGRIGDILNVLPPCRLLGIRHMLINSQFDCALRGQSYVEPIHWDGDMEDLREAVKYARSFCKDVRVAQLFGRIQPDGMPPRKRSSFVMDQWDRIHPGLGVQWGRLPLEFDQRDKVRESNLLKLCRREPSKPFILVNLFSHSSPMDQDQQHSLWIHLGKHWLEYDFVNLAGVRAEAFCDLLGLYDEAAGLITVDTSSLHLCRACPNLPTFRFVRPDSDATPIREFEHHQAYSYRGFDKIDTFMASLKKE